MRILLIASGDLWAGAEVMVLQLASGLQQLPEVRLCVVLLNRHRLADELLKQGVEVHIVDETKHSFLSLLVGVRRLVHDFAPDILHSHRYKENLLAWLACGGCHCRLVATQHGLPERAKYGVGVKARLRTSLSFRLLAHRFARTILVSEEMRHALVGLYGFSDDSVAVIRNGLALPAEMKRHPGTRLVVGSAGRLFPVKDFGLLVDTAGRVMGQSDQIDFVVAGEGPERTMLERRLRERGIPEDRFRLVGHREDMHGFYQGLDVYINTSLHEGIPMSVLEAMSHSLPVVAPDVGGFPEIIENGESGFLVQGRDPEAFARCLLQFTDRSKLTAMGKAARQRVCARFSQETMVNEYVQLYQELLCHVGSGAR